MLVHRDIPGKSLKLPKSRQSPSREVIVVRESSNPISRYEPHHDANRYAIGSSFAVRIEAAPIPLFYLLTNLEKPCRSATGQRQFQQGLIVLGHLF
jgi:hypothetical protein